MSDDARKPRPLALRLLGGAVEPALGAGPGTGTDAVAALGGAGGPCPEALVVVQDDSDTDGEAPMARRGRPDFKLVGWREGRRALDLRQAGRRHRAAAFSFTSRR